MSWIQIQWVLNILGQITAKIYFSVWRTQWLFTIIEQTHVVNVIVSSERIAEAEYRSNYLLCLYKVLSNNIDRAKASWPAF